MASVALSLRAVRPAIMRLAPRAAAPARTFSTSRMNLDRRYTDSHEWIDLSADGRHGSIGITEYAAKQLGDVVFVEFPEPGAQVAAGEPVAAVESVKSASDVLAPISCKVVKTNSSLEATPKIINELPEDDSAGGGWIVKVEVTEAGIKEFDSLKTLEEYKETLGDE